MHYLVKRSAVFAACVVSLTLSAVRHNAFDDLNRMFETMTSRMEQQVNGMFERMDQVEEMSTHAHSVSVTHDGLHIRVAIPIDKSVLVKDIIIDLDNGGLHVLIEKPERIEIIVEERWLTLTAERRETKDQSSAVSCASQQLTLPAEVDLSTVTADLTDGVLTLTFDKNQEKSKQRIKVTAGVTAGGSKQLPVKSAGDK